MEMWNLNIWMQLCVFCCPCGDSSCVLCVLCGLADCGMPVCCVVCVLVPVVCMWYSPRDATVCVVVREWQQLFMWHLARRHGVYVTVQETSRGVTKLSVRDNGWLLDRTGVADVSCASDAVVP